MATGCEVAVSCSVITRPRNTGTPIEIKLVDPATRKRPLLETLKRLRGTNDNFQVILRVDKDVSYGSLAQVLETCSEARIKTQNFELRKP